MGKVVVACAIDNLRDLFQVHDGAMTPEQVRTVQVADALVDTGATYLSMPRSLIDPLGLIAFGTRRARTSAGMVETNIPALFG